MGVSQLYLHVSTRNPRRDLDAGLTTHLLLSSAFIHPSSETQTDNKALY